MSAHPAPATWPRPLLVALGVVALLVLAILLFAWNRAAPETAQAAGPGPGMSLEAPATVFEGLPFTLTIKTAPAPDVEICCFGSEVLFPDELKWLPRPNCRGPGPDGEVQVKRLDGGSIGHCASFLSADFGGAVNAVISEIGAPPAEPLDVTPGSTTTLVELDFVCNTAGTYKFTLQAKQVSGNGAQYGDLLFEQILVKTVSSGAADTITINCISGPVPSPTPPAIPLTPTPTALHLTPTPPSCPLTPSGSPLPGMSLEAPATVLEGVPFTLCVIADPAPDVEICCFVSEVLFPDGLKWIERLNCLGPGPDGEVQVRRQDGVQIQVCDSVATTLLGGVVTIARSGFLSPPALSVTPGSTTPLVELDFVCNTPGSHKLTLTALPDSVVGSLYGTSNTSILVKTVPQDYDGDTVPNQVADTIAIECVAPVGGLVVDLAPRQDGLPQEASDSSGPSTTVLAGIVAAIAAGTVALGGAAWYARRRWG